MTERTSQQFQHYPAAEHAQLQAHLSALQEIVDDHLEQGGRSIGEMDFDEATEFMRRVEAYVVFEANYDAILRPGSRLVVSGEGVFMQPVHDSPVPVAMCEHHRTMGTYQGLRLSVVPSRENAAGVLAGQQSKFSDDSALAGVLQLADAVAIHPPVGRQQTPSEPLQFDNLEMPLIYDMSIRVVEVEQP